MKKTQDPTLRPRLEKFETQPTINQVLADPELLNHDNCWSFYDWFCKERTLERRAKALLPKIKFLVDIGLINGDENYVWFKNSSPMCGTLYDDFRFSSLVSGDEDGWSKFLGGVVPTTGHYYADFKCTIWTLYNGQLYQEVSNWSELKRVLKNKDSYIYKIVKKGWAA